MTTVGLVPVKGLSKAPLSRLASLLNEEERGRLSLTMLRDVLTVLTGVDGFEGLVAVTRDPTVREIAESHRIRVIEEPVNIVGEGPAVDYGAGVLAGEGVEGVLIVPSDLPLVDRSDIETLLDVDIGSPSVVMAPSDDGGTNALLKRPPDAVPSRFGPDSLPLHIREAESRGIPYRVIPLPSFTTDIDSPEDLLQFLDTPGATLTSSLVEQMGLRERLKGGGRKVS